MSVDGARPLSLRARELAAGGRDVLVSLPSPQELADRSDDERHAALQDLRVELYAVSSLLAELVVQRARRDRVLRPPYGLVRSMHSEFRMMSANPETIAEGAIDSYYALGKAYIDTVVFHLHRQFAEQRHSEQGWMVTHLDRLLALFQVGAGPATRARMRDPVSFIYGGLHFGTSVCVQFAEVMTDVLGAAFPDLAAGVRAAVLKRSSGPAFWLASLNVDTVVTAHQRLQATERRPGQATTWMDPAHFAIREAGGGPWRVELRDERGPVPPQGRPLESIPTRWTTLGCPARISPSGATSPIAALWTWCIELAHDTGLLGPIEMRGGGPPVGREEMAGEGMAGEETAGEGEA